MKTIIVIFTKEKIDNVLPSSKKYTFNTESSIKVGDLLKADDYNAKLQIVEIKNKLYKYFDPKNSELYTEYDGFLDSTFEVVELPLIKEIECNVIN